MLIALSFLHQLGNKLSESLHKKFYEVIPMCFQKQLSQKWGKNSSKMSVAFLFSEDS